VTEGTAMAPWNGPNNENNKYVCLCRRELNISVKDVVKSRLRIRALEDEVEKPMNVHRWRRLEVRFYTVKIFVHRRIFCGEFSIF